MQEQRRTKLTRNKFGGKIKDWTKNGPGYGIWKGVDQRGKEDAENYQLMSLLSDDENGIENGNGIALLDLSGSESGSGSVTSSTNSSDSLSSSSESIQFPDKTWDEIPPEEKYAFNGQSDPVFEEPALEQGETLNSPLKRPVRGYKPETITVDRIEFGSPVSETEKPAFELIKNSLVLWPIQSFDEMMEKFQNSGYKIPNGTLYRTNDNVLKVWYEPENNDQEYDQEGNPITQSNNTEEGNPITQSNNTDDDIDSELNYDLQASLLPF